jgi:hypothetical protein
MLSGFFVSMYYSEEHTPPDWYVETLAFLIGSFYGMKEVGKFAKGKTELPPTAPVNPVNPVNPTPNPTDIG